MRVEHNPLHHDFRMRYAHYELPLEAIKKLENLYFIKNVRDLEEKYREATTWFQKVILEIKPES